MGARRLAPDSPLRLPPGWTPSWRRDPWRPRIWYPPECAIGVNSATNATGDIASVTTTTTITKPTGTASTDVLVVTFGNDKGSSGGSVFTTSAPSGWTAIYTSFQVTSSNNTIRLTGFWALGSVSNLGFTNSSTGDQQGWVCVGFTGVDNTTPIDATGTTNSSTGATSLTTNAVTIATDQSWHLIAFASWLGGTNSATGFTARQNATPATNADATLLYNTTPKSVGSTGTVAVSSSSSATGQIILGAPFALRPAAGAAASAPPGGPGQEALGTLFEWTGIARTPHMPRPRRRLRPDRPHPDDWRFEETCRSPTR